MFGRIRAVRRAVDGMSKVSCVPTASWPHRGCSAGTRGPMLCSIDPFRISFVDLPRMPTPGPVAALLGARHTSTVVGSEAPKESSGTVPFVTG